VIDLEIVGARAVVTLNRAPVNAINDAWLARFHAILDGLASQTWSVLHIRSVQPAFCAGADIQHIRDFFARADAADAMVGFVADIQTLFARIEALERPTIAEIGGAALGGGLELALACDLRIAAREARLGLPEARLGLIPGAGGTQRLTRLCGRGVAARVILAADMVDGATAHQLGIVEWVHDRAELPEAAERIADRLASLSGDSIAEAKRLIAQAATPGDAGFAAERAATHRLLDCTETRRRVDAFLAGAR
jgi:enoyl-CoA hydratase